jgi:DNA-binding CsgD family transcriptional regulator
MEDIVDRIYEASVIPELWTDILDRLAAVGECDGGILIATDPQQTPRAVASDCYASMLKAYIGEGWICQNIRGARLGPQSFSGFVVDLDLVTAEEAETDALYVDCLRKHGGGVGALTVIPAPTGDLIIFSLERSYKKGFVDRAVLPALDALRPHLARSALLSLRLGLERAREMTETLKRLDLPGAVLNASGRVLSSNSLLDDMQEQFIPIAGGGLAISHRPAHDLFRKALLGAPHRNDGTQSYSIPVPATESAPACVAHLLPVRRQARDIFTGAAHIFVVTSVSSPMAPPAHILFGLFDLSPAEARVAQKIVQGSSVEEIATDHKISRETVRNQLKAVFAKTGTSRQAELVGLVMGTQIRAHGSS